MLPKRMLVSKTRWFWIALITLSPLGYLLGGWLALKYDAAAQIGLGIDREQAIARASEAAAAYGLNVSQWSALVRFKPKPENDLFFYQTLNSNPDRELAKKIYPATTIGVLLRSPDHNQRFEAEMTVEGRPVGFRYSNTALAQDDEMDEPAARKLAEAALRKRLSDLGLNFPIELQLNEEPPPPEVQQRPASMRPRRVSMRYTWKWPLASIPELKLESVLEVQAGKLTADRFEARIDPEFVRLNMPRRNWLKIVNIIFYILVVAFFLIFGIYRFVQRARQKEVSYQRVISLVILFGVAMTSFLLASDTVVYEVVGNAPDFPVPDWVLQFSSAMFYILMGLFLGLAYGSGEGDLREAYPGKLTSLDALLLGKIFSRNVARSTVWGWAIGGWLMLSFQLALLPWAMKPGMGEPPNPLTDAWLGYIPSLAAFLTWPSDVMLVIVIGLLVPLPFLLRRRWLGRLRFPLILLVAWIACAAPYMDFRPREASLLMAAARAFIMLMAFLSFDLLTAIIALASPTFMSFALGISAQPAKSVRESGMVAIGMALAFLAVQLFFAWRGKKFRDEEVRPVYARNLAERISMQAEVSAAREAQQRLMPAQLPQSKYFSVAATCLPAFEVGGDFYDVFELESGKIGVLVAEGGGHGLGSALSIAFAKGFLMPRILSSKYSDDSPTEVVRSLQDRLDVLLDDENRVGLAYAVLDASDGQLRYARTGAFPAVLAGRKNDSQKMVQPEERVIKFSSRNKPESHVSIIEGSATLNSGDSLALFTDRLAQSWKQEKKSPESELAKVMGTATRKPQDFLQQVLDNSLNECSKRARKQGVDDDLTALVIRLDRLVKPLTETETDKAYNAGGAE